jgi:hypothetical protein
MMAVNLLESIVVLLVPLLLAILLPKKWFYEQFVVKGVSLVLLSLGYLMFFYVDLIVGILSPWTLLRHVSAVGLIILGLVFLIERVGILNKIVFEFSSRAVVFLYIWTPVSIISLAVILVRNIF